jgi:four helix bundle protein
MEDDLAQITRFEDLQSWNKARELTNRIYDLTGHQAFARDPRLCAQIQNSAGSVMHNIAEGFDSGTNPEFVRFLKIARRSASEVQSQLYLAMDRAHIDQAQLAVAYGLATEAKRLINGMIGYLRKSRRARETGQSPAQRPNP